MALIKKLEMKKLSKVQAEQKVLEMERIMLELHGEGKMEKSKSVKKTIAALKFHIGELARKTAS